MEKQNSNNSTKLRLIHAAKKLFSKNNFDAVSTRMIAAEAGVGQSAIFFHFGSKDNLCAAVIDDILGYHNIYYGAINEKIREAYDNGSMTPELAFDLLCEFLKIQIDISLDPHNRYALCFSVNGYTLPKDILQPLDDSILHCIEEPMAKILCTYKQSDHISAAQVICHAINSSVFAFNFTSPAASIRETITQKTDTAQLKQFLFNYYVASLKAASL